LKAESLESSLEVNACKDLSPTGALSPPVVWEHNIMLIFLLLLPQQKAKKKKKVYIVLINNFLLNLIRPEPDVLSFLPPQHQRVLSRVRVKILLTLG
jgi:hypothetical protein